MKTMASLAGRTALRKQAGSLTVSYHNNVGDRRYIILLASASSSAGIHKNLVFTVLGRSSGPVYATRHVLLFACTHAVIVS